MQEVCNPELQDGRADSATVTKIASTVTGRTIGASASDEDAGDTCTHIATQHVQAQERKGRANHHER